jgi:hypothetical protein
MKTSFISILFVLLGTLLSSCSVIAEIFKTGVWFGIMMVLVVLFLIFYFLNKSRNKNGGA